jgi:hypothetical protein
MIMVIILIVMITTMTILIIKFNLFIYVQNLTATGQLQS